MTCRGPGFGSPARIRWLTTIFNSSSRRSVASTGTRHAHGMHTVVPAKHSYSQMVNFLKWYFFIHLECVCECILPASARMLGFKLCAIVPGFLCLCKCRDHDWNHCGILYFYDCEYVWFFFTSMALGWILDFELQLPWCKVGKATLTLHSTGYWVHSMCLVSISFAVLGEDLV